MSTTTITVDDAVRFVATASDTEAAQVRAVLDARDTSAVKAVEAKAQDATAYATAKEVVAAARTLPEPYRSAPPVCASIEYQRPCDTLQSEFFLDPAWLMNNQHELGDIKDDDYSSDAIAEEHNAYDSSFLAVSEGTDVCVRDQLQTYLHHLGQAGAGVR